MTETTRTISLSTVRRTATGTSSGVRTAVRRSSTGEMRPTFRYRGTTTATARTTRPSTGTAPGSSSNQPPEYLSPAGEQLVIFRYRRGTSREEAQIKGHRVLFSVSGTIVESWLQDSRKGRFDFGLN